MLPRLGVIVAITVPIVASIMLINGFLYPGATDVIVRLGPLAPSVSGFLFGLQITLRLLAASLALAVAYLATRTDDLLADLERRGLGRRATYVVGSAVETVPRTVERAAEIVDAQRSRGLDTEGRWWQRIRGVRTPRGTGRLRGPDRGRGADDGARGARVLDPRAAHRAASPS